MAKSLGLDPKGELHRYGVVAQVRIVVLELVELMLEVDFVACWVFSM